MSTDRTERPGPAERTPIAITDWARRQAPHLDVVSASVPEPLLLAHNLVAVGSHPDEMREVLLTWERIEPADGAVGTVALGAAPDRPTELGRPSGADPEGVAAHLATRAIQGGLPGAVIGAVVVALIVLALDGWSGVVIGAAIGGAAFGFVPGAVLAYTRGTGWGRAYRDAFVDPTATEVVFASIHSDDGGRIEEARSAVRAPAGVRLVRVGPDGSTRPA
ncbi:MAG: hypothetical protein R2697_19405 [Ilumatobacteraceae bacterium]